MAPRIPVNFRSSTALTHASSRRSSVGVLVASAGGSHVCVTDCALGQPTKKYTCVGETFFSVAWLSVPGHGAVIACGGTSGVLHLLSYEHNIAFDLCTAHDGAINSLVSGPALPDVVFSGSEVAEVIAWRAMAPGTNGSSTGGAQQLCRVSTDSAVQILSLSPCGTMLAAGLSTAAVSIWSVHQTTGKLGKTSTLNGVHSGIVDSVVFVGGPHTRFILSRASGDAFLALCRAKPTKSGVELESTGKHMFPKFSEYFFKHASYTDQQGRSLVIGGDKDGNIFVYILKPDGSCKLSKRINILGDTVAGIREVSVSPCRKYAAAACDKNILMIFDSKFPDQ